MPGEFDFIDWIRSQRSPFKTEGLLVPPGDDLAVMQWGSEDLMLVGNDQVLDGVHFDSKAHSPRDIGRKVMNRNLSDCGAMACLPAAAVVTAALPRGTTMDYAKELYLGMKDAADRFTFPIVGGDTATWDGKLVLTVSIIGCNAGNKPITRSGAKVGDFIYVTGPLGGSILGRHMTFTPRVLAGHELGRTGNVSAMIDLSDGLSRDLRHICRESNVGAVIFAEQVPVHDDAIEMRRDGHSPLEHALHDGEDYELLFTSASENPGSGAIALLHVPQHQLFRVGKIIEGDQIWLETKGQREPLEPKAWEHQF